MAILDNRILESFRSCLLFPFLKGTAVTVGEIKYQRRSGVMLVSYYLYSVELVVSRIETWLHLTTQ